MRTYFLQLPRSRSAGSKRGVQSRLFTVGIFPSSDPTHFGFLQQRLAPLALSEATLRLQSLP
jgi:hypothetical protein